MGLEKDRTAVYKYGGHAHHERVCGECGNTRKCKTCHGKTSIIAGEWVTGCAECDYTGICQECVLWAPTGGDDA